MNDRTSTRTRTAPDRAEHTISTATVLLLAVVAAVVSFRHALAVVQHHGETGLTAYLTPLTMDGLVLVATVVNRSAARHNEPTPHLAKVALGLGIGATVAVNVLHGIGYGPLGAAVAGWPALAFVISVELLNDMTRRTQARTPPAPTAPAEHGDRAPAGTTAPGPAPAAPDVPAPAPGRYAKPGTPEARAVEIFADDLAAGTVPSARRIKATLRVGQSRAQKIHAFLRAATPPPSAEGASPGAADLDPAGAAQP